MCFLPAYNVCVPLHLPLHHSLYWVSAVGLLVWRVRIECNGLDHGRMDRIGCCFSFIPCAQAGILQLKFCGEWELVRGHGHFPPRFKVHTLRARARALQTRKLALSCHIVSRDHYVGILLGISPLLIRFLSPQFGVYHLSLAQQHLGVVPKH